jgi:uncharacterized protein (TIGR03067 family)
MRHIVSLVLIAGLALAGGVRAADAVQKELKALQGTWTLVAYEYEGKRLSRKAAIKEFGGEAQLPVVRIKGEKLIIGSGDNATEYRLLRRGKAKAGTYSLNPAKTPKTVDITYVSSGFLGGHGVATMRCIYRVKGDRLKICCRLHSAGEKDRPKDFTTDDHDSDRLVIFKRVREQRK